jgi:hypothetical protein
MHPELKSVESSTSHQVCAKRVLLWEIRGEIHLLPFVALLDILVARETKLSQVPPPYKIKLTGFGLLIDTSRVPFFSERYLIRVALKVCTVMPDHIGVLMPREPVLHLKLQQTMLIEFEVYTLHQYSVLPRIGLGVI